MTKEENQGKGAIWDLRDLVGDLADQIPAGPGDGAPAARTIGVRPPRDAPNRRLPGTPLAESPTSRPDTQQADSLTEGDERQHPALAPFGGLPVVPTDKVTAPEAFPRRPERSGTTLPSTPMLRKPAGVVLAVLLVVVGTAYGVHLWNSDDPGTSGYGESVSTPNPYLTPADSTGTPDEPTGPPDGGATTPPDPEAAALAELHRLHDQDLPTVNLDGRYVAQLASKSEGIVDPRQQAANGSHTFYASDILAEHLRLRVEFGTEVPVVLLLSTDYGQQQRHGNQPLWLTFAVLPEGSKESVASWCGGHFAQLTEEARQNLCVPRRLRPPGT
ncbi:hypothetical protein B5D80_20445 [Micromonospora wenchangensis]|uniref:Uncharacterized protein n=1 Tax=Micromonospora wenchangensis TaxID=1185415 RepID=A0A246RIH7_9ACTN|nr:hypothetical protein [Micromonospora wenchangensis]OWV04282.1 hypothetical protein B5D80_20445 [Micromonospora wenchangensis]